ncbi:hypothetical protein [Tamlana crocina]|uniref:Uncharacterized protein n=1 Tax=Tamlana crocina TaxID=393006 RepID=A0ABX1DES2_9FLAO|nr:hypothetical protein [Tamlana crocina]NJX16745.1 hypothetical protein [Tamlana crocina]
MSDLVISDKIKNQFTEECINDSKSLLNNLKGRTSAEIEYILYVTGKIAKENATLP